ncbi:disease resistance protein RGA2-like [Dendrobium catenatum]|uniref:disease resistance protein RGA2-like n=1 Tax=Dendrobium catenatum TaxID=906689 RepID=UPI00109F1345|nr:disease resistance protein RGA2-like [Dendrobium catenatum]
MEDKLVDLAEKLIRVGFRYVKDQIEWDKRTKEPLARLKRYLPQIQAVAHYASSQEQITDQNKPLNEWLWQLRDAIDDAFDVVDELEYMELEKQVTKDKKLRRVRSIMKSMKKKFVKIGKRALKIDPTLKRLEDALQKLYEVTTTGVDNFLYLVKDAKKELQKQQHELHRARETGSSTKNDLIGLGKEKKRVMEWLRNPSNEHRGTELYRNISLLSIVGHGGMGKTTLLQNVYNDEITKEFGLKMWVCVSNNFDVKKVIADMLQSLKKEKPRCDTLDALQNSLRTEIMSQKFLLVLDDIWEEDEEKDKSKWEDVLAPLSSGGFGSKILVTTRTDSVALAKVLKKKKEIVKLEGLAEDECLQLLNSHAFAGVENSPNDHENLRVIARDIVKKLSRSPLAAKVIGGVLNSLDLDARRWREVLESNLLDQNSIQSILRLSYIVLSNHLRNCFAFCCIFPEDHEFDKDDLVRMWIALGFIRPSQGMTMEDIGGRYFDALVKKALFDKVGDDYKMHDLIHESASKFFSQVCCKLVGNKESSLKISETIRHLFVLNAKPYILRKIEKLKHLHSLFLFYEDFNDQDLHSGLIEVLKTSRSLRLLYIWVSKGLEIIPEEIENLIHLRYLKIDNSNLTMLPRSVSNLYHLQYIIYKRPYSLSGPEGDVFLPSDINSLANLRYLEFPENSYISSIYGIGKLMSLSELYIFDLRDMSGYRIGELENMNDLCKLGINCLENVKDAEEACSAKLCSKSRLRDLTLCWSNTYYSTNNDLDENVLDNLHPPKCLRKLRIERYMGARSAIWMNNVNLLTNIKKIEEIELIDCKEWETLPPFGQLPFLKILILYSLPKVKCLESKFNGNDKYHAFPSLLYLLIASLESLEDWFEEGVAAEDGCLFPCLIELVLEKCPKLKELPSLPPKLKNLYIDNMGWKTLNFCSNSNPIPLETLHVVACPNITSIPLADEIARLAALRSLRITNCPNLISLGRYRQVETTNNCQLMLNDLWISDPKQKVYQTISASGDAETWPLSVAEVCLDDAETKLDSELEFDFLVMLSFFGFMKSLLMKSNGVLFVSIIAICMAEAKQEANYFTID